MSLKKKIAVSFFISASIIAALMVFVSANFIGMRKEINYLELTDTIRSKSLQLRRHEKNFFLYGTQKSRGEAEEVHRYIKELNGIVGDNLRSDRTGRLKEMAGLLGEYAGLFEDIEGNSKELTGELEKARASYGKYRESFPLIELTLLERPLEGAQFLERTIGLPKGHRLVAGLVAMDSEINALRKKGEAIISLSKELDRTARDKVDHNIKLSQAAIIIFFPLFLVIGIGTQVFIISGITARLKTLADVVDKTGKGNYPYVPLADGEDHDEVGVLVRKFNEMEAQLAQREMELKAAGEELLQAKKLAAIGTLASGVAHELNNPLNNIYISAQVLARQALDDYPPVIKEVISDIVGQTARVKRIVGDLLEFARGKEPQLRRVEIGGLIEGVYGLIRTTTTYDMGRVKFSLEGRDREVFVIADPDLLERVFINLFTNAADAMKGEGELSVRVAGEGGHVRVSVSDTGEGISRDDLEKVFEPFYSTKDKGTGLGLAIVFNILKKHGGDISVDSEKGRGTTFTITLPGGDE